MPQVIDIREKLSTFNSHWTPKVIAELNGQHVKVAKLLGSFDWHFHEDEDELFWVISGKLVIHFRDSAIELHPETYKDGNFQSHTACKGGSWQADL